ncbi:MAG: HD domain-containing protein [Muribaculaceae bacterium]|nr:HD domain-containing protein [Muribaculaceae bacterium]
MIDALSIIYRFYEVESDLCKLLIKHSTQVAELSRQFSQRLINNHVPVDIDFVVEAAMLHDIGIVHTNAPGIYCHGTEPYIRHGVLGRTMLEEIGLFRHALVCERHTGTGLSIKEIETQQLPLPLRDLLPVSIEEKIVCYADKFFSKSHPDAVRSVDVARSKLIKFGEETVSRFDEMQALFGAPDYSRL